jgi:hypothetical protein
MVVSTIVLLAILAWQSSADSYRAELEAWRRSREAALTAENGWLTVVGLFWLSEGENPVGTKRGIAVQLPQGCAPESVGVFKRRGTTINFEAAPGANVTIDGQPATRAVMRPDSAGSPTVVRLGGLSMFVIERGGRFAIRLRDKDSEARRRFEGLKHFPPDERYRVRARFVPYDPPKIIPVPNILGAAEQEPSPGYVLFRLDGREHRLDALASGDSLFFIFKDHTAGKETYPAGRFLYTPQPTQGEVVLDFNRAINPPCAFTPYATCPLPPKQNELAARIEAGELNYAH